MKIKPFILSFFTRVFKGYLSDSEIKDFVLVKYRDLIFDQQQYSGFVRELFQTGMNLAYLGWINVKDLFPIEKKTEDRDESSSAYRWFKDLKNNRIIEKGIIAKGSGVYLDWFDENNEDLDGYKAAAIESILKIVEVKRKKTLEAFPRELAHDEKVQEGLRISILLSRASRRHKDLRYLNAALKLNDWYFSICRKIHSKRTLVYYLLALTEQERSIAEMLN